MRWSKDPLIKIRRDRRSITSGSKSAPRLKKSLILKSVVAVVKKYPYLEKSLSTFILNSNTEIKKKSHWSSQNEQFQSQKLDHDQSLKNSPLSKILKTPIFTHRTLLNKYKIKDLDFPTTFKNPSKPSL